MTLYEILATVRRRLWLILAGAVIAGAVAAIFSLLWPPTFKSEASLLITKLRSNITLDPRFQTVAEENVVNLSIQEDQVRRQTLVALTESRELLMEVLEQLGDTLAPGERSAAFLDGATDVRTEGNLIIFEAEAGSPAKAAAIAEKWAETYEGQVNRLYSTTSPTGAQMQARLDEARASYEAAKEALQTFVLQSPENELNRQIEQKKQILADLQAEQIEAARKHVATLLARVTRFDGLLLSVASMREQLAALDPGAFLTPGEQFAIFTLDATAFAQEAILPVQVDLTTEWLGTTTLTVQEAVNHLDQVADALGAGRVAVQQELDRISGELLTGEELLSAGTRETIATYQAQISELEAELERQAGLRQDLADARDLGQENYLTLAQKATEVDILSQLTGVEVQLAAHAVPPEQPAFPRPLVATLLGLVAGGLVGLALAFALDLWPRWLGERGSS